MFLMVSLTWAFLVRCIPGRYGVFSLHGGNFPSMRPIGFLLLGCGLSCIAQSTSPALLDAIAHPQVPNIISPMDAMIKAQQLRRLQLENQAIQQRNEAAAQQQSQQSQGATRPSAAAAYPLPDPPVVRKPPSLNQAPIETQLTLGFSNGRAWNGATAEMKLSYVTGMLEVLSLTQSADLMKFFGRGLTVLETAQAVERFYAEPENLQVPVTFALQVVAMKTNGESPEAVAGFTAGIKKAIIDLQSK